MRYVQTNVLAISPQKTKTGKTMFKVKLGNGEEPVTFENATATLASQTGGAVVNVGIEDEQNGQYTNHYLREIQPIPGAPMIGGQPIPFEEVKEAGSGGGGRRFGGGMSAEDKTRITKLAALDTAFKLVSSFASAGVYATLEEAEKVANELALRIYQSARSHEGQAAPAQPPTAQQFADAPAPAFADPAAIAAAAAAAGAPVQVGVAGVAPVAEPAGLPWS